VPNSRCPSPRQLEQLLDEQLDDAVLQDVTRHVDACPACQATLEQLTSQAAAGDTPAPRLASSATAPTELFLNRLKESPPESAVGKAVNGKGGPAVPPADGLPAVPGYELLSVLGRGGMGVVYKARQVGLNRLVALKMILSGSHSASKGMARFLAEAEAVARLRHPNIVQIYDIGEASGNPYFALEYVEGGSLARRLSGEPQPVEPAVRLVETLARSIHFAHEQGIVHRDLKPANVLIVEGGWWRVDGKDSGPGPALSAHSAEAGSPRQPFPSPALHAFPKITDFGLAKRLDEQSTGTQTGEVIGTPSYMAPEQAAGKARRIGPATDVYSLGAILYELLTGRPPFKGASALETVVQVLHEDPIRPSRLRPDLPRDLEILCLKCLEKDPRKRYPSAEALADELRRFRQGKPIEARPVGVVERTARWTRRHPLPTALLAVIAVVTVTGFAGVAWQWRAAGVARDVAVEERKKARTALYFSRIAQSQLQWRVNDVTGSRLSLEKCIPATDQEDRRGWEWYYLGGLFHTDLFTLRHPRGGAGGGVAVRPDGRWIASVVGGDPGEGEIEAELQIWDAEDGRRVRSLTVPVAAHRVAFAPAGDRLALACTDGAVLVWDPAAGKELLRLPLHINLVSGLAFSPDGRHVASSGWDNVVKVWVGDTGKVVHTLKGHTDRVQGVAYHPGGRLLASAGWDATVKIWDIDTGKESQTLRGHLSPVFAVAFSPDGRLLASAGSNGNLKIWDVASWRVVQSLTGQTGAVLGLAFSPDGRYLAYGGGDATVRVWDVESGVERFIFRGHTAAVEGVQFSPDGRRLVSTCPAGGAVKVWDLTRHPEHGTFARTRARGQGAVKVRDLLRRPDAASLAQTGPDIEALAFHPTRGWLLSVTVGGTLQTWDAKTGMLLRQRSVPMSDELVSPAVLAAFGPGGEHLAARDREDARLVRVWDVETGAETAVLRGHTQPVFCLRFSPDGRNLLTCGCDPKDPGGPNEVRVWQFPTGKPVTAVPGVGQVFNLAMAPDGKWVALALRDGDVMLMELAHPRRPVLLKGHKGPVGAVAFSPDGLRLASAGLEDRRVFLWDLSGGNAGSRKARPPQGLPAPAFLCDLAFSPDGKRLAGVSRDLVKMWDVATGHEVLTLRGAPQRHWDPAFNPRVLFSPDGKRLAATNWDETISVWEAEMPDGDEAVLRHLEAHRRAADVRSPFWHLQEAEDCLEHNNPAAARFHLERLLDAPLPDPLRARKERLVSQLREAPAR
jgi:eukaryotic-like serine/threonine-protein kinase